MKILTISLFLFLSVIAYSANTLIRIVCMGNSITHGKINKTNNTIIQLSYRPCLWEKLDSANINVDMVGYTKLWFDESANNMVATPVSQYTGHVFDRDHDAYFGITSSGLLNGDLSAGWTGAPLPKLADRLKTYTADIALLHIGTNDKDADLNLTVANIEAIIDQLRLKNPTVTVFVAKLITGWKLINTKVDQIVLDKSTLASPVIAVDLATDFINDTANPATTMTYDWVHPNPKGQQFMASRWFKAIQKQLQITAGIEENFAANIEIYPSISSGLFTLKNASNANVQVVNMLGSIVKSVVVLQSANEQLDLLDLFNGMYLVNINQNGKMTSRKLIVRK